jgi:adenylate cyclase
MAILAPRTREALAMSTQSGTQAANQELWTAIFRDGHPALKSFQRFHNWLPSPPRCKMCYAPFHGVGGMYMRLRGKGPANRNPRYCGACDKFLRSFPGGAEVDVSMMFVDVRGSVPIAERMAPADFSHFMRGFFASATQALIDTDGFVVDFRGDCVVGVYPPGFSGADHARKAVEAARHLLNDIPPQAPDGGLVPIGIGVHTGLVFIGTVSGAESGMQDITILGHNVNIAARLSQSAEAGEALISEEAVAASGLGLDALEVRKLVLKGKSSTMAARVLRSIAN